MRKSAIAMIELVVVITVMISISVVALVAGSRIIKSANIAKIISEVRSLSSAISSFHESRGYYPGDVLLSDLTASLSNNILQSNVSVVSDGCTSSKCQMGSGHISVAKSILGFGQMAKLDLLSNIDYGYSLKSKDLCSGGENLSSLLQNKAIPSSKYDKSIGFIMAKDDASVENLGPKNSIFYNSLLSNSIYGKLRIILTNISSYSGSGFCEIDVANQSPVFYGSGAVSAVVADEIDRKIDDGRPSSGVVLAENDNGAVGQNGCTDLSADFLQRNYLDKSESNPRKMCIMSFVIG